MRIYKELRVIKPSKVLTEVVCDNCGRRIQTGTYIQISINHAHLSNMDDTHETCDKPECLNPIIQSKYFDSPYSSEISMHVANKDLEKVELA